MQYTCSTHNGVRFSQRHNCSKEFRNNEKHIAKDKPIIVLHNESVKEFYGRFYMKPID